MCGFCEGEAGGGGREGGREIEKQEVRERERAREGGKRREKEEDRRVFFLFAVFGFLLSYPIYVALRFKNRSDCTYAVLYRNIEMEADHSVAIKNREPTKRDRERERDKTEEPSINRHTHERKRKVENWQQKKKAKHSPC